MTGVSHVVVVVWVFALPATLAAGLPMLRRRYRDDNQQKETA